MKIKFFCILQKNETDPVRLMFIGFMPQGSSVRESRRGLHLDFIWPWRSAPCFLVADMRYNLATSNRTVEKKYSSAPRYVEVMPDIAR